MNVVRRFPFMNLYAWPLMKLSIIHVTAANCCNRLVVIACWVSLLIPIYIGLIYAGANLEYLSV